MNNSSPRGRDVHLWENLFLTVQTSYFWFRRQTNTYSYSLAWGQSRFFSEQMSKAKFKWGFGWTKSGRYLQPSTLSINNSYLQLKKVKYPLQLEGAEKKTVLPGEQQRSADELFRKNKLWIMKKWLLSCSLWRANWAPFEPFKWALLKHLLLLRLRTQTWY